MSELIEAHSNSASSASSISKHELLSSQLLHSPVESSPEGQFQLSRSSRVDNGGVSEPFSVSISVFDGPLDLLLHLVKLHELPIEKISLGLVAEQFLDCVIRTQSIEVEIAGEYLVIASTLLSIKARYVLQDPADETMAVDESLLGEDPHEALLRRLKELAVYKEGAEALAGRPMLGVEMFAVPAIKGNRSFSLGALSEHDPMALGRALRAMAKKRGVVVPPLTFVVDRVSVGERMRSVLQVLTDQKVATNSSRMRFEDVVDHVANHKSNPDDNRDSGQLTAAVLISCFLAILELCRRSAVWIEQVEAFDDLFLMLPVDAFPISDDISLSLQKNDNQQNWLSEFDGEVELEVLEGGRN